ncbi:hypothetical protein RAC89_00355 [Paenibacillus sp. GD4]|uniref:hypothetical protein n=1 Tax=Paenibacillus sp. GD4 TaxID=3068890 RepID=UPI00279654DF|nr:hypothetical protein [Paenibacillus sp. GD4]MDQ1908949.1 hypothetical protein [Paenibacillus sp. GD4]
MNFPDKIESINQYLDKLYAKLIKDSTMMNDWSVLHKSLSLEPRKLSVYADAIKEELKTELYGLPAYKSMSEQDKQRVLKAIDQVHERMAVPEFRLNMEECMEEAFVTESRPAVPPKQAQPQRLIGPAAGAVVGLGLGMLFTKSVPVVLLTGIGGALAGQLLTSSNRRPQTMYSPSGTRSGSTATAAAAQRKLSHRKVETVIRKRKEAVRTHFLHYLKQLEEVCLSVG